MTPQGTGLKNIITITVTGQTAFYYYFRYAGIILPFLTSAAPVIYGIFPLLPTTGGSLFINGTNFGQNSSLIIAQLAIAGICLIVSTQHEMVNCLLPEGTGTKLFTLTVDGQTTHSNYTYQSTCYYG